MRLSRSASVVSERRREQGFGSLRTRKKHKRLDAICEKAYNRSHRGVKIEANVGDEIAGNESELRRSTRVRRAPVVLDSSPPPAKKRRKVDGRSEIDSAGREKRKPGSDSRNVEEEPAAWRSRLRSRAKNVTFERVGKAESSPKGKRKLFHDSDEFSEEIKVKGRELDGKEELEVGMSTVVKSKRPGRVKASCVLRNANQEIGWCSDKEHDKQKNKVEQDKEKTELDENENNEVEENKERNEVNLLQSGDEMGLTHLDNGAGHSYKHGGRDGDTSQPVEKGESESPIGLQLEVCIGDDNVESMEQDMPRELPVSVKEAENQRESTQVDQVEDGGCHEKPLEDYNSRKDHKLDPSSSDTCGKLYTREGRKCGLCGTGTDGKPPKKLLQDGAGSDHEAYSGSSASEEPNYDTWDGFGDEPGWLGRLLGPINDRYGIAGIWVHQHCAVWSPEVYFAGLGCLKNVRAALCRGRVLKCTRCGRPGATIGCRVDRCPKTYHLPCARANGCIFDHRKFLIACTDHRHLFQPHGSEYLYRIKKMKAKKMKLELRKLSNDASRRDIESEEKWLENCGEDEEFLKRESKRLYRDLLRIAPVYIGGSNSENDRQFQGWESVAGLQDVIQCMKEVVILPLLYPEFFNNMGITPPRGVLLHGYPGTGKTLVVRALIGSCARGDKRIAYFARKGADCLGKYVGDAERQLRLLFQVAEKAQPSIIFFDEIDGLAPCRTRQQDQTHNSVVSTLLALLDGLKSRGSVVVIGATNRPDAVDPALRRPGRFDREIYFPLPSVEDRAAILSLHTKRWPKPVTGSLLNWIARRTAGFAGADLQALCTQAAMVALRRNCPLQELLSEAEKQASHGKYPPLPPFAVEERDWLEALSCAPPPCSQRGAGMAANDVVSSPLLRHLIPCLLQPLSRLLVSLYLDERLLLPSPLYKAAVLIKSIFVSSLDKKKVPSDHWWTHVDGLLQEVDVMRNIETKLLHLGIVTGQDSDSKLDAFSENTNDGRLMLKHQKVQQIGARTSLLQNVSDASGKKSGFRTVISGNPRSGQRYLASCLLHCFVGNVEIQKVDLATISQEGHGDVMQGVTRILMRCASVGSCMVFMPRIDLWAIETCHQVVNNESDSSLTNPEISDMSFVESCAPVTKKNQPPHIQELSEVAVSEDASQQTSYIWNSFVELVESICVSTSLIILATSEVPFQVLPLRVRQFFQSEITDCIISPDSERTIPRFSMHLDGKFSSDAVINSSAVELSNDLIQQFVQFIHHRTHVCPSSCMKDKSSDAMEVDSVKMSQRSNPEPGANEHEKVQLPESSEKPLSAPNIRPSKGKPNLLLAISTFGYQILRYPHFAELCWVTSKLKGGPYADINGPWKGWPFNSCIVRPSNSSEMMAIACNSNDIKNKEKYSLVRGLVAVGLSAYRGMYTSLREVSSEVRKVFELLAEEINAKIQAGRDWYQFSRLLSQMAYLEDVVNSWAYTLQSLEADAQTAVPALNTTSLGYLDNHRRFEDKVSQNDGCEPDVSIRSSHQDELLEESPQRFDLNKGAEDVDPISQGSVDEHSAAAVLPLGGEDEQNGTSLGPSRKENSDGPCSLKVSSSIMPFTHQEAENQHNEVSMETCTQSENGRSSTSDEQNADVNNNMPGVFCLYRCCSKCIFKLRDMMRKILNYEWGLKERGCTVEDVHDMVASKSARLHSAVRTLFATKSTTILLDKNQRLDTARKMFKPEEMDACRCKVSDDRSMMPMECSCHSRSEKNVTAGASSSPDNQHGFDLKFICRDGVISPVDNPDKVLFHCKFETLCLCSLIEWIEMSRLPSA
ncbi:uncharacterized protein LOC127811372 isoform X2 [Diospyros lotus]|uniref:uncharacterized protein LOC127811372 isoform X2 n=1 Tax=Diospyros lotus TaxID=55363 RepID=UPI002250D751|nr:uncharacterized protein LOC127811372 isoform X2 [Diospyros lotus]